MKKIEELAKAANKARGEERKRIVEELAVELLKRDPFEGIDPTLVWLAKTIARLKWIDWSGFS